MTNSTRWNMYPQPGPFDQVAPGPTAGRPTWMVTPRDPYPTWMFAGRPCTVREFADFVWPEDHAQKTAFLLKWADFFAHP